MKIFLSIFILLTVNLCAWEFVQIKNQPGLQWGSFEISTKQDSETFQIYILKIDPEFYKIKLLTSSEYKTEPMTIEKWCQQHDLVAGFNAGMYATDLSTSVGLCINDDHINNGHINQHNSILATNPRDSSSLEFRIIDRTCENFDSLRSDYKSYLQSIRMLSCNGNNVWKPSEKKHSILAIAQDSIGNLLICFCQKPLSGHDFTNFMMGLPLKLTRMMYLEGGAQANLIVNTEHFSKDLVGCIKRFAPREIINPLRMPIPNIIGIQKK